MITVELTATEAAVTKLALAKHEKSLARSTRIRPSVRAIEMATTVHVYRKIEAAQAAVTA